MPLSNVIVNGSFSLGNAGWTGTDLETNFAENAYLGNGSGNAVAEMDGNAGPTTQMSQTFTLTNKQTTDFTFRTALRTASLGNAGIEGFRVEIVDSAGTVIETQDFFPTSTTWTTQSMQVVFPAGGTYTVRLTELGPDDSLGAIIDDVGMLVCFVAGTLIDTERGPKAVEMLSLDDRVWTQDAGWQPVLWVATRQVSMAELQADPALCPVMFDAGSLGAHMPVRRMGLSPQHRVCVSGWQAELLFGADQVLVAARALINGHSVRQADPVAPVTYVHFLLDQHHLVRSDGVLTESFLPTALSLSGVDRAARDELARLFPDLPCPSLQYTQTARPVVRQRDAALLAA